MSKKKIYFGYGSNLNEADWDSTGKYLPWSEALTILEPAFLLDYVPVYHYYSNGRKGGALDVYPHIGGVVEGMLFIPTNEGWNDVDEKEGSPHFYIQTQVEVQTKSREILSALTYTVIPSKQKKEFIAPTKKYAELVESGMMDLGLNPTGQNAAAKNEQYAGICEHVFVYGTLRQGHGRENLMITGRKKPSIKGKIRGDLVDLGEYPGLKDGDGEVVGELHSYDDVTSVLNRLDQIEGFYRHNSQKNLFERILCDVETTNGSVQAWTYRWTDSTGYIINSGDWNQR